MIRHIADKWFREEDLTVSIPGRSDPPDVIAECIHYLRARHRKVTATDVDARTRTAIVHARVQTASANPGIRELQQQIAQRDHTIDRLLAFVHTRVAAIPAPRLKEIVAFVSMLASQAFPGSRVEVLATDEDDSETEACHRIEITAYVPRNVATADLVAAEVELRRAFVDFVTPSEFRAITLLME